MEVNEIKESSNLGLEVEQMLKKFNIGAFLSPSLWGLAHGKPIGLLFFFLSFIPFGGAVAGFAGGVWFGINGRGKIVNTKIFQNLMSLKRVGLVEC